MKAHDAARAAMIQRARQQVDAWDAEVDAAYKRGLQDGMKQERALWTLSKLGQEIEACQYAVDVAMPEYRCVGKCQYAAPPQRPWVGLTDEEMYEAVRPLCKADSVARSLFDVSKDEYRAIEAKLKEKNT